MLLGLAPALAASVALLPLDGRGVDASVADDATEALRDALADEGSVAVPTSTALSDLLLDGHDTELRKARERYAAGRKAWEAADTELAIPALTEGLRLHGIARSEWTRRGEVADVHWILAQCLLREGRVLEGRAELEQVAALWPGYTRTRGTAGPVPTKMLAEVELGLAREAWSPPEGDVLDDLFRVAGPDLLVVGVVDETGLVRLRSFGADGTEREVSDRVGVPIDSMEEAWGIMAGQLADLAGPGSIATRAEEEEEPGSEDEATPTVATASAREAPPTFSRPVRIKESGSMRYDDHPVTSRWWFWTALVGVVGGSTAAAIVLAQPPEVVEVRDEDAWSVSIVSPDD
ncbi:MAG: tetratricopeptide repeat protein [Deltaproteobacteria bacterium]|nr:tetratricopeptide repeat protein [Deltaproteobacteria bacterium]